MEKLGVPEVRREQPHGHHHNWRCVHDGGRGKSKWDNSEARRRIQKKSPNTKTNTDTKTETLPGEDEVKVS